MRSTLLAAIGFATCLVAPSLAQSDGAVEEPWPADLRLGGTLVLSSDEARASSLGLFRVFAEGAGRECVVLHCDEPDEATKELFASFRPTWHALGAELPPSGGSVAGAWVVASSAHELLDVLEEQSGWGEWLRALVQRGGVVGASGAVVEAFGRSLIDEGGEPRRGCNLAPDVLFDLSSGDDAWLDQHLATLPKHVGIRIEEGTAFVLRGRQAYAAGTGAMHWSLPGADQFPPRHVTYSTEGARRAPRADLTAWRRDARERVRDEFPAFEPAQPIVEHGTLVIVGGGGMPSGLLAKTVEWAGGDDSSFVYIPCTEAEEVEREPGFVRTLRQAGAGSATWVHTKQRDVANGDESILEPLSNATGLWFAGGRQWNFVDSWLETESHDLMHDVLRRGGVVAGSSAGASIQGTYLARADPLGNLNIVAPGYERGLGFLPGVAIDQHFAQRSRFKDMTGLMETYPELLGIGIDETTALVVKGRIGEVHGEGQVHFYNWRNGKPDGEKDHLSLSRGLRYDLVARRVESL